MARPLRMFKKKALQVAPEPEGSSCHLPKGQSNPCVPTGGEAAPVQARRRKCPAFWKTKPAPGAGAELGEAPTRPKWSWPRMRFCRQDPAQEGRRAGWLWGLLCGQQRPQEPSPRSHQEASPCPVAEDHPAPSGQEVEGPCPSTGSSAWDSSSPWDSGSSEADGRHCFVPGTPPWIWSRRKGWTWPQMKLLSRSSESSSSAEKRMRSSSSCSCRPSTPYVSLHGREGRTRWSRTAARQLW
ncbi:uncharacterized protein LOC122456609 isoform X2 [Dermochelys coriacea]|uniref:uncharacterized protein LOC122456609 isoform X2 n=1 Tax=Dermochelys coriacea TaxID=27794 RepID=UPI001CA8B44E|nr:uncharacterized protein LOC122456609 isoform X2 [Dermochelys coriacea]